MATKKQINLRKAVVAYLDVNPEKWHQGDWAASHDADYMTWSELTSTDIQLNVCGTTMCIAGTAAFLDARQNNKQQFKPSDGSWISYGAELLGLKWDTASDLFNGSNQNALAELRKLAQEEPTE